MKKETISTLDLTLILCVTFLLAWIWIFTTDVAFIHIMLFIICAMSTMAYSIILTNKN